MFQTVYNSATHDFLDLFIFTGFLSFPLPVIKAVSHNLSNNHSISEHSAVTWFIVCGGKKRTYSKISTNCTWPPHFRAGSRVANILGFEWKDREAPAKKGYIPGKGILSEGCRLIWFSNRTNVFRGSWFFTYIYIYKCWKDGRQKVKGVVGDEMVR